MDYVISPIKSLTHVVAVDGDFSNATVEFKDNKLILSKEAAKVLDAQPNDHILLSYWFQDNNTIYPLIEKREDGNRLTKSLTVSYRGAQAEVLKQYGTYFKLEKFKSYYRLVKIDKPDEDLSESINNLNKLN